ncbi:hypothetical protein E3T50_06970 [Cryobacterium gelidum]|uniref:Integrase catalytic domain-containing protein n=2 Tax=Cryobacterium gelidum TaxID=1259164 RepID=A0A4R9AW84_9MICO|nr:DDE-type integrase/transposase/recombinase [Cryobacterium gelidum]TFD71305.1 hypothetical protein E3T50_06970 [Cryobacterium gelidum]
MKRLGLAGICSKKWKTTTIIDHADAYPVDAVKRQWDLGAQNQVWVGDITYLRTREGWVYLATVIDAHSRRVIGWAIADHMSTDLIQDALTMAIVLCGDRPATVISHSDRGTHYASGQITAFAAANGITRSMGLTVICWDCETINPSTHQARSRLDPCWDWQPASSPACPCVDLSVATGSGA